MNLKKIVVFLCAPKHLTLFLYNPQKYLLNLKIASIVFISKKPHSVTWSLENRHNCENTLVATLV